MTVEDSCNLEVAQATNILAIIDFTAGRTSSAWLKIGMAIRIAQDLQLMKEPSETLPLVEQEERRRSFWSIYLLDKLVSLGKHRHFAILDEDCHVRLPCDELTFRSGGWGQNVTLRQLRDWSTDVGVESGFPVAILASSVLARCTRRLLHDRNTDETPPWDSKSEFASITSLLLLVESRLQVDQHPIRNVVDTYRLDDGVIDHPAMGHVIFARTVFHVCYCLLYHPFLVREQVRRVKCQVPSSFMRLASQKSYEHARDLVNLLHDAEAVGCHLGASFYAYSACLAGSILSLHMHTEKDTESQRYLELLSATQDSISILEGMAKFWDHASKIHHRLLTFNANAYLFDSLLDTQLKSVMDPGWERSLWSMVDYGEMCRESNLSIPSPKIPAPSDSPSFPDLELESEQMLDLGLGVQQISQIDDNLMNFDTPNIKYLLELASGGGLDLGENSSKSNHDWLHGSPSETKEPWVNWMELFDIYSEQVDYYERSDYENDQNQIFWVLEYLEDRAFQNVAWNLTMTEAWISSPYLLEFENFQGHRLDWTVSLPVNGASSSELDLPHILDLEEGFVIKHEVGSNVIRLHSNKCRLRDGDLLSLAYFHYTTMLRWANQMMARGGVTSIQDFFQSWSGNRHWSKPNNAVDRLIILKELW
ncbi:hypothetical protein CLIM01_06173 [Colletotrichum limetticola]|uniref:Xylanolytic transcriptional activator regulatory domain-containing protein n=1 Tax=Colletotrichum limetticola TaxID=1209924 RepID=A0ABQ9PY64_9PEZI|nr:hypothetical protein CLIM01_06173 [Colletotrichum limetticola]